AASGTGIAQGVTGALSGDTDNAYTFSGGQIALTLPQINTSAGSANTVSFWMNWNGTDSVMPFGFNAYDLSFNNGSFGFNTGHGDIYGISSAGLANAWHLVTAVFNNGDAALNQLWIDGVQQALTQ